MAMRMMSYMEKMRRVWDPIVDDLVQEHEDSCWFETRASEGVLVLVDFLRHLHNLRHLNLHSEFPDSESVLFPTSTFSWADLQAIAGGLTSLALQYVDNQLSQQIAGGATQLRTLRLEGNSMGTILPVMLCIRRLYIIDDMYYGPNEPESREIVMPRLESLSVKLGMYNSVIHPSRLSIRQSVTVSDIKVNVSWDDRLSLGHFKAIIASGPALKHFTFSYSFGSSNNDRPPPQNDTIFDDLISFLPATLITLYFVAATLDPKLIPPPRFNA